MDSRQTQSLSINASIHMLIMSSCVLYVHLYAHQQLCRCVQHFAISPCLYMCNWHLILCACLSCFKAQPAAEQSLNDKTAGDAVTTKVAWLLCNHQAHTHVPCLLVSQYMEQMAGRVLNKHKYMFIMSLGYRQLLLPILPFARDVS